jgi:hypothetical protein
VKNRKFSRLEFLKSNFGNPKTGFFENVGLFGNAKMSVNAHFESAEKAAKGNFDDFLRH